MSTQPTTLEYVTSKDGTRLAYERQGSGPAVILVCGGSVDRQSNAGLAAELASDFTVYNYDRRGRGDSGDTTPYAVEHEVEDIAAVVAAAGEPACLYGTSSGAALALEAAHVLGGNIAKLALWEAPFIVDENARPPADHVAAYTRFLAEGDRSGAVEYFTARVVGLPPEFVAFAKTQPFWAAQEKIAHTLPYDGTIMGDYAPPIAKAAEVTCPTIVIAGSASFPFMRETAKVLADALPNGELHILEGQEHNVSPQAMAPVLAEFFAR